MAAGAAAWTQGDGGDERERRGIDDGDEIVYGDAASDAGGWRCGNGLLPRPVASINFGAYAASPLKIMAMLAATTGVSGNFFGALEGRRLLQGEQGERMIVLRSVFEAAYGRYVVKMGFGVDERDFELNITSKCIADRTFTCIAFNEKIDDAVIAYLAGRNALSDSYTRCMYGLYKVVLSVHHRRIVAMPRVLVTK